MLVDPYEPPRFGPDFPGGHPGLPHPLKSQCVLVGIIFIVLAVAGFFGAALAALGNLLQVSELGSPPEMEGFIIPEDEAGRVGYIVGYYGSVVGLILSALLQPLVLWAGINLIRARGLGMARIGAVVSVIPGLTSCCCAGIPFGIWALILLARPEAKPLFERPE